MCGICGIFDTKSRNSINEDILVQMTSTLIHRGPDELGHRMLGKAAFGFARLSIIGLESGMQPISNEDGTINLVCNGEIYNYRELKSQLCMKGHKFRTDTDVEVILHLYEDYGAEFLNMLNGQFAFAIHDANKDMLICARDHVGIAPFFYTIADGYFLFASEIKALLKHEAVKREVDLTAFDMLLTFPGVISPRTMFKDIYSLENGHYLVVHGSGRIEKAEYWDLIYPKVNEIEYIKDESCYIERLDELLGRAVKRRLQADVPVGFYISGGLDSSIIASKIRSMGSCRDMHSFSIDFTRKDISESKYQRLMADFTGSIHHETLFGDSDICKRLKRVIYHSESPLKETYNSASMALSESVRRQGIKVVLTGEGADELFAGYVGYRFDKLREMQPRQLTPQTLRENEARKRIWGDENFFYEKDYHAYTAKKREIYSKALDNAFEDIDCTKYDIINKERIRDIDILHKRSYADYKLRLPEHLLADHGDRMCFSNSVEARYPFLDKELIEFAAVIPPELKLKNLNEKYILKQIARDKIPGEIVKRPKFAFVAPGSTSIMKQNIEYINDLLSYERIKKNGYFCPDTVERLKMQYMSEGFKLNLPYDTDMLIIVITMGMFLEEFNMPDL